MVEAPDQSPQLVAPSRARTRMPHAVPIVSDLSALRPAVAATAVAQLPDPERWPRPYAPMPVRSSVPAGQPTRTVARVDDICEPATKANVFGAVAAAGGVSSRARQASTMRPVAVSPRVNGDGLPLPRTRARSAAGSFRREGQIEAASAATPETCGVAIDVPSSQPHPGVGYLLSAGSELRIPTPGATTSTLVRP